MTVSAWHQLCTLREDVRTGRLTLDEFAADLNGVRTGESPPVYREATMFFSRTYPTFRMKQLVRDVLLRLAGEGGKPVQQLQVAYGGGKTHTLITLLHLAEQGQGLADHRTVQEFVTFAGLAQPPQARVALLPFDKFDVKEGLEVYGPDGHIRRVQTPWGALAHQLAGDAGYARLKGHDEDLTVPAEPLLVDLLRAPLKEGLGALVLVDEAVWYYRNLVLSNPRFFGALKDFYQVLTQAVVKVKRAALVAGLIASKVEANDQTGIQCLGALEDIFGRIAEPVEPVAREDVAEVLRRRLFETVPGEAERRPVVDAVMAAMQRLPVRDAQRDQAAYDRMLDSYPFHPDLIEVLYQKWTQYGQFQRTRGALRLLAYALREAMEHDPCPLVGPWALLSAGGGSPSPVPTGEGRGGGSLSPALNELIPICQERQKWGPILTGELEKAREVQASLPTLRHREIEQAVIATFLHSHPPGQRAAPSELTGLLVHPEIDPAAVEEGLRKWRGLSWFLVEDPEVWRLSTHPNLNNIHVRAMEHLNEPDVDVELRRRTRGVPALQSADPGVVVHMLPNTPADISDNLKLHYLALGPECAVEPGKPLPPGVEAYFDQVTGPQNPRIYRNNLVALVPEAARLAGLREQVRRWLGWDRVERIDEYRKALTEHQKRDLPRRKQEAANNLPEAVVGAYNLLVAVDEAGQVRVQTLRHAEGTAFDRIKATLSEEERILVTTLDPDLLLPGSYLDLWGPEEESKRVESLMAAFGQFTRLPRLLRPEALYDTLRRGLREGTIVLRLVRGDGSVRTFWRIPPDEATLMRPDMEVQPASQATLHNLDTELLKPDEFDDFWPTPGGPVTLEAWRTCFDGQRAPRLHTLHVLDETVRAAVRGGLLMARVDQAAYFRELLPEGPLPDNLELLPPPDPVRGPDLTIQALPEAWRDGGTTAQALAESLAARRGYRVPWVLLQEGVDEALRLHLLERTSDSSPWPCSPAAAGEVVFQVVEEVHLTPDTVVAALSYTDTPVPSLRAVKEAVETAILGREIPEKRFLSAVQSALERGLLQVEQQLGPLSLAARIRRPSRALMAETTLGPAELQALAEAAEELLSTAPGLDFTFRVVLTAEGELLDEETLERLNAVLEEVKAGWRFGDS
jgi:hypothetical protein